MLFARYSTQLLLLHKNIKMVSGQRYVVYDAKYESLYGIYVVNGKICQGPCAITALTELISGGDDFLEIEAFGAISSAPWVIEYIFDAVGIRCGLTLMMYDAGNFSSQSTEERFFHPQSPHTRFFLHHNGDKRRWQHVPRLSRNNALPQI
jgi:hypothetical protein